MKSFLFLACGSLLLTHSTHAQSDAVRAAIERFENSRKNKAPNEVTVVIEPPSDSSAAGNPEQSESNTNSPVEPTPTPPTHTGQDPQALAPSPREVHAEEIPAPKNPVGVVVALENIRSGTGQPDPADPSIDTPFPPKPLAEPPPGWRLEVSQQVKPFRQTVDIGGGKQISLSVKPHLLVPETDGLLTFSIVEPGYTPEQEYHQTATVGAILSKSLEQLDEDSKHLGSALDELEQILLALPKPAPKPVIIEDPELSSP